MSKFIMPAMKAQSRGRKSQTFFFRDLEERVYKVNSIRRFSELTEIPMKSFYALTSGRAATLYGLTLVPEDEKLVEGTVIIEVNSDTE